MKMLDLLMKNWKLLFHFFHVICKISNFNIWTAKHLTQASCTELTLLKLLSRAFWQYPLINYLGNELGRGRHDWWSPYHGWLWFSDQAGKSPWFPSRIVKQDSSCVQWRERQIYHSQWYHQSWWGQWFFKIKLRLILRLEGWNVYESQSQNLMPFLF